MMCQKCACVSEENATFLREFGIAHQTNSDTRMLVHIGFLVFVVIIISLHDYTYNSLEPELRKLERGTKRES